MFLPNLNDPALRPSSRSPPRRLLLRPEHKLAIVVCVFNSPHPLLWPLPPTLLFFLSPLRRFNLPPLPYFVFDFILHRVERRVVSAAIAFVRR
jgi:hypothetical protein